MVGGEGLLHQTWIVAYGGLILIGAVLIRPFLLTLPRTLYLRVLLSAGVFLTGAVGMEIIGGFWVQAGPDNWVESAGINTWSFSLIVLLEEGLEMLGVIILINALLNHLVFTLIALAPAERRSRIERRQQNRPFASQKTATAGAKEPMEPKKYRVNT